MTKYETIAVFDGSLPQEAVEKESKKIEELLSANGKIVKIDDWGKRVLAYQVKKKTTGYYVLFVYEYDGNAGKFIEDNFKFNEKIIRYLTVIHEEANIFAPQKAESEKVNNDSDEDDGEE